MNILQFSKFYPPVHGGIETIAQELTEGLQANGLRTDVLCANLGLRTKIEQAGDCRIVRAGSLGLLLSTSMSPQVAWHYLLGRSRYDLVHVHLPNPMANLAMWIARSPARVVLHWHSDIVNQPRALRLYVPLQDWLLGRADAVIATSQAYAEHSPWLRPYLSKVRIVPPGFDPANHPLDAPEVATAAADVRRRHGGRPIVFALGRMTAYKGFEILIDAAARLRHDAQVIVAGGGVLLEAHREHVAAAGLEGRVAFVGNLSALDVHAHLAAADVFCLPSRSRAEAFGMVLLEAMAARLPIVSSDIEGSGISWVNVEGETGYNVPVGSSAAMAAAIDNLLADRDKARRIGEAGYRRLVEHFSTRQMIEGTLAVYREAFGERYAPDWLLQPRARGSSPSTVAASSNSTRPPSRR